MKAEKLEKRHPYKYWFTKRLMHEMTRREFFRESFGLLLGVGLLKNFRARTLNTFSSPAISKSDLIIAHNGTPKELLEAALEGFGGIQKVVKKGQKVVVKVNVSFNRAPEHAADTNPELVETLVRILKEAGAREVLVIDHTLDNWRMCFDSSGIESAVKRAGGKIEAKNSERDYEEVSIPQGKTLKKTHISKDVLDADVFINVPIAKVHGSATVTLSMKNLMGTVWDRGEFHWKGLHDCIADLSTYVKPDLIILDAYRILMTNGPGGPGEVKEAGEVVIGTDPVAVDTYGSILLEKDPASIGYIKKAAALGLGTMDMDAINTTYVDAQQKKSPPETKASGPEETEPAGPEESEVPESEPETSSEPVIEEMEPEEEEKEAGIPAIILIPAVIVSFVIGLRMRRMRRKKDVNH